jgi:hypothetical protein
MAGKKAEQTNYLLFCSECGVPHQIPDYIIKSYFVTEVHGVYCKNCNHQTEIPDYLKKIADHL